MVADLGDRPSPRRLNAAPPISLFLASHGEAQSEDEQEDLRMEASVSQLHTEHGTADGPRAN